MSDTSLGNKPQPTQALAQELAANLGQPSSPPPVAQQPTGTQAAVVTPPPAETETTETSAPPPARTIAELAAEAGFADVKDDADATARLFTALREHREAAEAAARRAQQLEELQLYREQYGQQQQQATQPNTASQAKTSDPFTPPELDEAAIAFYYDAASKTWKDGTPPELKAQAQRYEQWRRDWQRKLVDTPRDALGPLVEQMLEAKLAERLAQHQQQTAEEAAQQQFLATSASWLYAIDPMTNVPRKDPRTGQYLLSVEGQVFESYMNEAAESGIAEFSKQLAYANRMKRLAQLESQATHQTTAQQAQQTNAQHKQDVTALSRASVNQNPSRSGSFAQPGDRGSQNPRLSAGQKLLQEMQETSGRT